MATRIIEWTLNLSGSIPAGSERTFTMSGEKIPDNLDTFGTLVILPSNPWTSGLVYFQAPNQGSSQIKSGSTVLSSPNNFKVVGGQTSVDITIENSGVDTITFNYIRYSVGFDEGSWTTYTGTAVSGDTGKFLFTNSLNLDNLAIKNTIPLTAGKLYTFYLKANGTQTNYDGIVLTTSSTSPSTSSTLASVANILSSSSGTISGTPYASGSSSSTVTFTPTSNMNLYVWYKSNANTYGSPNTVYFGYTETDPVKRITFVVNDSDHCTISNDSVVLDTGTTNGNRWYETAADLNFDYTVTPNAGYFIENITRSDGVPVVSRITAINPGFEIIPEDSEIITLNSGISPLSEGSGRASELPIVDPGTGINRLYTFFVLNSQGNPIPDARIEYSVQSAGQIGGSAETDSTGHADVWIAVGVIQVFLTVSATGYSSFSGYKGLLGDDDNVITLTETSGGGGTIIDPGIDLNLTYKITVMDSSTSTPILGAEVTLIIGNSITSISAFTNSSGVASFTSTISSTTGVITVSKLGYSSITNLSISFVRNRAIVLLDSASIFPLKAGEPFCGRYSDSGNVTIYVTITKREATDISNVTFSKQPSWNTIDLDGSTGGTLKIGTNAPKVSMTVTYNNNEQETVTSTYPDTTYGTWDFVQDLASLSGFSINSSTGKCAYRNFQTSGRTEATVGIAQCRFHPSLGWWLVEGVTSELINVKQGANTLTNLTITLNPATVTYSTTHPTSSATVKAEYSSGSSKTVTITLSSSDTTVATVSGTAITSGNAGTTTISGEYTDNSVTKTATATFTVNKANLPGSFEQNGILYAFKDSTKNLLSRSPSFKESPTIRQSETEALNSSNYTSGVANVTVGLTRTPGTYTVYWYSAATTNYKAKSGSVTVTITAPSYVITFDPSGGLLGPAGTTNPWGNNSGTSNTSDVTVTYGDTTNNKVGAATKTNYTFAGWYTAMDIKVFNANGTCVAGNAYWDANSKWIYKGDVTLYAVWDANLHIFKDGSFKRIKAAYKVVGGLWVPLEDLSNLFQTNTYYKRIAK